MILAIDLGPWPWNKVIDLDLVLISIEFTGCIFGYNRPIVFTRLWLLSNIKQLNISGQYIKRFSQESANRRTDTQNDGTDCIPSSATQEGTRGPIYQDLAILWCKTCGLQTFIQKLCRYIQLNTDWVQVYAIDTCSCILCEKCQPSLYLYNLDSSG